MTEIDPQIEPSDTASGGPSDTTPSERPFGQMTKIDRIDGHGDICEHWTRDGRRTLCGVKIGERQPPCGNRSCKRCEKIVARYQRSPPATSMRRRHAEADEGPPAPQEPGIPAARIPEAVPHSGGSTRSRSSIERTCRS